MLQLFRRKAQSTGFVGVSVSAERIALAHITQRNGVPFLAQCARVTLQPEQNVRLALQKAVAGLELEGVACSYLLAPTDYSLHLIEAPAVEQAEMRSAVRWKVKDLLDVPVDEAAIDIFPLPEDAQRGRAKTLYVVAAASAAVRKVADLVENSGLELNCIDIPELAMRNLTTRFLNDEYGLAFMALRQNGSTINLTKGGKLYLTRRINTQLGNDVLKQSDWSTLKERLVLEVQRSLDFYESQMGQSPISQLVIAPRYSDTQELVESLDDAMAVKVSALDITDRLQRADDIRPGLAHACIAAVGAALRDDGPGKGSTNEDVAGRLVKEST